MTFYAIPESDGRVTLLRVSTKHTPKVGSIVLTETEYLALSGDGAPAMVDGVLTFIPNTKRKKGRGRTNGSV